MKPVFSRSGSVAAAVSAFLSICVVAVVASFRICGSSNEVGGAAFFFVFYFWYVTLAIIAASAIMGGFASPRTILLVFTVLTIVGSVYAWFTVQSTGGCTAI